MNALRRGASLAWRLVVLEVRLYAALLRWCLRRTDVPAGAEPWGYAQLVTPVLWLWAFGSAVELVVLHVIIPWEGVRLAVDVVSAWGLIWMLGALAAYRIRPHLLHDERLQLRNAIYHDFSVPRSAIAAAQVREADLPSSMFPLDVQPGETGACVSLGVGGRVNVVLTLEAPTAISTSKGVVHAQTVRLWADEPKKLVARLNERLGTDRAPAARRTSRPVRSR